MKIHGWSVMISVLVLGGSVCGASEKTNDAAQQISLEINLADGSRLLGTPGLESLPVQTSYAKMDIPLQKICSVKMEADHEQAAVELLNGDKLKGVITLKPIALTTIFGVVSVNIEHIRDFRVRQSSAALQASLRRGLVLYYSFDDDPRPGGSDRDNAPPVRDLSGKGNSGTVHDAKWTPDGKRGGAYLFNGQRSYIDAGNAADVQAVYAMSVWVKGRTGGGRQGIISKHASGNNGFARTDGFYLIKEGDGKLSAAFCPSYSASSQAYSDEEWHHIASSVNPETGRVDLYVDGKSVAGYDNVAGIETLRTEQRPLFIGRATWDGSGNREGHAWSWNGLLDEVMLWNRPLSADEAKQLYNAAR